MGEQRNTSIADMRQTSQQKLKAKMVKAIKIGRRRASSTMETARNNVSDAHTSKGPLRKIHFKGATSLCMQAEPATRIKYHGAAISQDDDIEGVMGIIQSQLMSEHGEGIDPEK